MAYTPENNPYIPGDPYSYDLKWIINKLKGIDSQLAAITETYGSPLVVYTAAEMKDSNRIYIYLGSETGYTSGDWYYYDKSSKLWLSGGAYGGYPLDNALDSDSANAVKNRVIYDAIKTAEKRYTNNAAISPVYMGDFICSNDYYPQAVCKKGNFLYVTCPNANGNNNGDIRVFDLINNIEVLADRKTILMGHGNSICYNDAENLFYIAPQYSYTNGLENALLAIYRYTEDFSVLETIPTPTFVRGLTYDPIEKKIFYSSTDGTVYALENGNWVAAYTINFDYSTFNQGFAKYGNEIYITDTSNRLIILSIQGSEAVFKGAFVLNNTDTQYIHKMAGEYEDIEFSSDGHLLAISVNMLSQINDAFISEIVTDIRDPYEIAGPYWGIYNTGTLSDSTKIKFHNAPNELKHLMQLSNRLVDLAIVNISTTTEMEGDNVDVFIRKPIHLRFMAGSIFYISTLNIFNVHVLIWGGANSKIVNGSSSYFIQLQHGASLTLSGNSIVLQNIITNDRFIYEDDVCMGYLLVIPTMASGNSPKINNTVFTTPGIYWYTSIIYQN